MDLLVWVILYGLIFGAISAVIGQRKNLSAGGSFAAGFFLGIFGLIMVIVQKPALPPAPPLPACMRSSAPVSIYSRYSRSVATNSPGDRSSNVAPPWSTRWIGPDLRST